MTYGVDAVTQNEAKKRRDADVDEASVAESSPRLQWTMSTTRLDTAVAVSSQTDHESNEMSQHVGVVVVTARS